MTLQLAVTLSGLVGLALGALAVKFFAAGGSRATKIRVSRDSNGWKAETQDKEVHLKRLMYMRWQVVEVSPLPAGAYLELRFAGENSPFTEKRPKDDQRAERTIGGVVPTGVENGSYKYTVYLIEGAAEKPLEDPIIVIEGKR
jgi:hypothetical protein